MGLGMKLARCQEHIFHMAGATSPQLQTKRDDKAIREAGRNRCNGYVYEPIRVLENAPQRLKLSRIQQI